MKSPTTEEAQKAQEALAKLKMLLHTGRISYDNAAHFAEPHLKTLNAYTKAKARDAGLSVKPISFSGYMR